jgi:HEAT repeat protein
MYAIVKITKMYEHINHLLKLFNASNDVERSEAIDELYQTHDVIVREQVTYAVINLDNRETILKAVKKGLQDEEYNVQSAALFVIESLSFIEMIYDVTQLFEYDAELRQNAADCLARLGKQGRQYLLLQLKKRKSDKRLRALLGLSNVANYEELKDDFKAIENLLGDENGDIRATSAWLLARIDPERAKSSVIKLSNDNAMTTLDKTVWQEVEEILGYIEKQIKDEN